VIGHSLQLGIVYSRGRSVKVDTCRGNQGNAFVSEVIVGDLQVFQGIERKDLLGIIKMIIRK
jgi:hypothetical protein